ncbi:GNAT family N-acetyltransferase [Spelaeicoccus albus]|uniref:RimJ/RimL family protein N-acetyltransferase n=1 Tax=Spelaeicoccus albus TaxID=1280376 RepID=A0A7Z0D2K7_9MICO|nr:GNAT family protein [Spelaeicoccus albus]NYI67712.1 RimJ/RimL family protein N-acetyltransferase [Spelaeicoccus albus]
MADTLRAWSANADSTGVGFAVSPLGGDDLIGHVAFYGVNPVIRAATLGVMLGPDHVGLGYGADAVSTIVRYGFLEFGLNRIDLSVWAFNTRAIRTYEKTGFTREGRRRETVFHDGEFHDEILMSILAREWRDRS